MLYTILFAVSFKHLCSKIYPYLLFKTTVDPNDIASNKLFHIRIE